MPIPTIFLAIPFALSNCTDALPQGNFDKLSEIVKSVAKSPQPERRPPEGRSIVSFRISKEGKAIAFEAECASNVQLSKYLRSFVSAMKFRVPDDRLRRYRVGLEVTVGDEVKVAEFQSFSSDP